MSRRGGIEAIAVASGFSLFSCKLGNLGAVKAPTYFIGSGPVDLENCIVSKLEVGIIGRLSIELIISFGCFEKPSFAGFSCKFSEMLGLVKLEFFDEFI